MPLDYIEFAKKIKSKYPEYNDIDDLTLAKKMIEKYPEYKNEVSFDSVLKKKEVSQSTQKQKVTSSVTSKTAQKQPSVSSVEDKPIVLDYEGNRVDKQNKGISNYSKYRKIGDQYYKGQGEIFNNYPGKEGKAYRFDNGKWFEYSSTISGANGDVNVLDSPIKDPMRVDALNRQFKKQGGTEQGVLVGYPGKEQNEYKIENNQWKKRTPENKTWVTITNEGSINALNNYFKKDIYAEKDQSKISKLKQDNQYSVDFNRNLKSINSKLIGGEEESVVPTLIKKFPTFKFNETGAGDRMIVTAPNGQQKTIILDNWTWDEDKRNSDELIGWMQANNLTPSEQEKLNDLRFKSREEERYIAPGIGDTTAVIARRESREQKLAKEVFNINKKISKDSEQFLSQEEQVRKQARESRYQWMPIKSQKVKEIQDEYSKYLKDPSGMSKYDQVRAQSALGSLIKDNETIKNAYKYQNDIKYNIDSYKNKSKKAESYILSLNEKYINGEITKEEFENEINLKQKELLDQDREIKNQIKISDHLTKSVNQSVAENYLISETKGGLGGGLVLSGIKGMLSPVRLLMEASGEKMSAEQWHEAIKGAVSPFWDFQTSLDYLRSEERPDLYKAAFSVSESLGAMLPMAVTGGATALGTGVLGTGTMGAVAFYPMSYYEMKDELEDIKIPESHKVGMAAIYGLVASTLESIGMQYVMGKFNTATGTAIKRNILRNVLSKSIPKDAPKEFIDALVRTETKAYLANLGLTTGGAMLVEGTTESLQSLTGAGIKESYDLANKKDLFNTTGLKDVVKGALYEGYLGALGGGMVHSIYVAKDSYQRKKQLNSVELNLLMMAAKTEGISEALMTNLKADMLNGRMTKQEAIDIIANFNTVRGNLNQMPENLTPEAQSVSLSLMMERDRLNKQIEGKDLNLVKPQTERINEINTRLQEIAKESSVQVETTIGVEIEEGKPQVVAEEVIPQEEIATRQRDTESSIKRKDLFNGVGAFSRELGGSDVDAVPVSHSEEKGIEFVQYANPNTGSIDVIVTGTSNNDFVGYYRIYENGKPTNKWSSKFENQSRNKENFKTMISGVQAMLPEGHQYTEKTSISTDGLRVWNQQLERGYELQYDKNGNLITNEVAINGDSIENVLGVDVNKGSFESIRATREEFEIIKKALIPYMEKFGLGAENIKLKIAGINVPGAKGLVTIDLPVLLRSKTKADAVQGEVTIGREVEEGEPQAKPQDATEKSQAIQEVVETEEDIKAKEIMTQLANAERTMIQLGRSKNPNNTDEVTYTDLSDVSVKDDFTPFYKSITDYLKKNNEVTIYDKANNKTYRFNLDGNTLVSTLVPNVKAEATQVEAQPVVKPVARKSSKQNLVTQENVEELRAQQTTPRAQKIFTAAKLAMKALPGVNIYIHKNKAEYEAGINEVADNNEYGSYLNGEIHINLEGANVVTILHEAMHHALVVKGIKSGAMLDLARGLKSVISDKQLKQRLEEFTSRYKEEDDRAEEYAAELGAIMAEAKQELTTTKFQQFKNLINKIAKKLGLPVVFSEAANAKNAVDFMNSLTKAIRTGENIEPYTSGESATVIKNAPLKVRKKRISQYTADFIAKLPIKTLKEVISKYEGRIFFVQSDATGVGYDSKGDPIYGGLGYITIKENVDGSIGFASVDDGTAKTTISKMINRYGEGKKVGVFIMIQNPSSTVGNYYGAKYFGRALIELQKKSKTNYKDIANSFIDYIKSNKKIVDELNKNKTQQKLIDLIKNPEKYNEKTFANEFIKDTTFEARRNILESLIPVTVDVKTNKSTPYIKQSLKDIGFSRIEFLKEYGDNTLFTEDMYLGNEGGFLAAGFEIELPKKEQLDEFISKYKNNGVKHPQFNGKLPNTGESFLLDGLYPVNENFVEFAKDETIIDKDVLSDEELKKVVQENFPNDSFYEDKFTSINSENYIPRENRTYSHLKTPNKIIFKSNLEKTNPKALKSKPSDVATNVARGMGFSPEVGEKQKQLTQKTEFTKREAQAKRKKQLSDSKDIAIQKAKEKYTLSVEQRGNPHKQGVDAALNDLRKSDWYNTADDTQRENAERELKEFFGERLKKAPSVAKITGKPKAKKVAIKDEYKAMITQIKMEAKAAREAKADLNAKRKMLAAAISGMVKTGKIKASQAAVLVKRVSSLNLDNPVMVERFTNYAQRVFERADYQQRLDDAFKIRKGIRKDLKTDNQAEVSGMAKAFTKIDPSLVEDIDAYMEMADKVKNAVKPSRVKGLDVVMKESANIAEISEYTNEEITRQEDIQKKELLATYDFLEGEMSLKEMQDVINALKDPTSQMDTAEKEKYVKDYLNGRFGIMSSILDSMFKTGVDPMTGEEITFDEKQKELIKRALNIDLNEMSVRDAIKIVEGVENFITNQITSGLEAAVSSYEGAMNVKSLVNRGRKAKSLRLFFSKYVGKIYSEQLFSLPMLMEKMFGGVTNSIDVMNKMGLIKLVNGVNKANRQHNEIIDEYSKQPFYATKNALGRYVMNKGFMDAENVYERGMLAFLKRNLVGNPTEMKAEFERRVRMIQESINKLIEDGDPKEQKMGELYQKIYDKLGVAEMDMDVINSNASNNNLDAVNWWVNQWSQHYSDLSDISLSVYNTQLGSDLNYTPDKYKRLSSENQSLDEGAVERNGAFAISIDYTDKKKTGVLMETTRPNVMPDGRYISLDFDTNNSKALKAALVDINTAAAIRQVDGFINSKSFKKLIPESEDRTIMTKRINTYIRRAKGKSIVPSDTIQYIKNLTNYITSLGVGKALGGISQAVSQTMPVMVNTVVNAGRFDIADANFNAWLNKSGLPISNRGLESQSTVESIDRKIDMKGTGTQEALKKVADLNQWYLKQFLVKPDVFVARSSFKSYYLQNLKRRGISTDIDWTTHEMDMEAAEYAQAMIDRQQNISDPMLAGEFLSSDEPMKQIARKIVLPFASFILNQKARMYNDLNTITSKTATSEDKVIARRSLAGLAAELAAYQMIGFGIRRLYDMIAASLLGDEDDEETKKKKLINATKYPVKSIVNDIVSPLPMTDGITTWGLNQALAQYPWMSDKEIKDAVESRNKVLELKGEPSMTEAEEKDFIAKIKEEATYQVFDDEFNRSYGMIGIVGSTYQELGEMSKLATTGEFTDEYQGMETTKKILDSDREKVKYAVPFMIAYSTGLLPKDVGSISRNYVNRIKKKAITEKQYERYDAVQKDLGRNLKSWEIDIVKSKKESETAIDEIKFIERNGGLTERQGREYLKVMKAIGEPSIRDIIDIKDGKTADQILK
jgi:hypothetical protein